MFERNLLNGGYQTARTRKRAGQGQGQGKGDDNNYEYNFVARQLDTALYMSSISRATRRMP